MIKAASEALVGDLTVYIVTPSGTLHQGFRGMSGVMTNEGDNLDQVVGKMQTYTDFADADAHAKQWCKRCFPMPKEPNALPLEQTTDQETT
jgi:hypothetical protein